MDPKSSSQHFCIHIYMYIHIYIYIYICNSARKILSFHLDLRRRKMNLIHVVRNLFLRNLQALIARLDKTKNELNKMKMEFSSIK